MSENTEFISEDEMEKPIELSEQVEDLKKQITKLENHVAEQDRQIAIMQSEVLHISNELDLEKARKDFK
jgi:uncharacterized protein HemX